MNPLPQSAEHSTDRFVVTLHADRMRYARLIADVGPEILSAPEMDLWTAAGLAALRQDGLDLGKLLHRFGGAVCDMETRRGLDHIIEVHLAGTMGSALVRLSVHEDEFGFFTALDDGDWAEVARVLLEFEVAEQSAQIDAVVRDGRINMRVGPSTCPRWEVRGVEASLVAVAAAVTTFH